MVAEWARTSLPFDLMLPLKACGPTVERGLVIRVEHGRCGRLSYRSLLGLFVTRMCTIISAERRYPSPISLRMNATHDLRFRLEEAKMGGGFGSKLQAISQPQTVRQERQPQAYLFNCTPAQSVVHSVLAAKESAITCFSSACASALFESVIWPRHCATHSLSRGEHDIERAEDDPT